MLGIVGPVRALEYGQGSQLGLPAQQTLDSGSAELAASPQLPDASPQGGGVDGKSTKVVLAEDIEPSDLNIRLTDLLASEWALRSVAPRSATSGIGTDVDRDLFLDGRPLDASRVELAPEGSSLLY